VQTPVPMNAQNGTFQHAFEHGVSTTLETVVHNEQLRTALAAHATRFCPGTAASMGSPHEYFRCLLATRRDIDSLNPMQLDADDADVSMHGNQPGTLESMFVATDQITQNNAVANNMCVLGAAVCAGLATVRMSAPPSGGTCVYEMHDFPWASTDEMVNAFYGVCAALEAHDTSGDAAWRAQPVTSSLFDHRALGECPASTASDVYRVRAQSNVHEQARRVAQACAWFEERLPVSTKPIIGASNTQFYARVRDVVVIATHDGADVRSFVPHSTHYVRMAVVHHANVSGINAWGVPTYMHV